jgi:hypothetical protein
MSVQAISWALSVKAGSATNKAVLLVLANYANQSHDCWPAFERVAEEAECSVSTVRRAIVEMEKLGLLKRERRRRPDGTLGSYLMTLAVSEPALNLTSGQFDQRSNTHLTSVQIERAEPGILEPSSDDDALACAREGPTFDVWPERLRQAQARAGDALDRTQGSVHHYADLKALCEPTRGDPCDWDDDVLPAIDATAASCRARGKLIRSWTWVREAALAIRTRRLAGNPEMTYEQPRAYSPPPSAANQRRSRASIIRELAVAARAAEQRRAAAGDDPWDADPFGDPGDASAVRPRLAAC